MRYLVAVLGIIAVVFLVIVIFFKGDNTKAPVQNAAKIMKLTDYADKNSMVSVTTIGTLVGEENRREIRVTVTPTERRLEVLSGYEEAVMSSQSFPNTQTAYANFLSALSDLGFTSSHKNTTDPRGVCPTGNRYIYDLSEGGDHLSNLWQVNCDIPGTFAGHGTTTRQLFQQQIPGYDKLVQGVKL